MENRKSPSTLTSGTDYSKNLKHIIAYHKPIEYLCDGDQALKDAKWKNVCVRDLVQAESLEGVISDANTEMLMWDGDKS